MNIREGAFLNMPLIHFGCSSNTLAVRPGQLSTEMDRIQAEAAEPFPEHKFVSGTR